MGPSLFYSSQSGPGERSHICILRAANRLECLIRRGESGFDHRLVVGRLLPPPRGRLTPPGHVEAGRKVLLIEAPGSSGGLWEGSPGESWDTLILACNSAMMSYQ